MNITENLTPLKRNNTLEEHLDEINTASKTRDWTWAVKFTDKKTVDIISLSDMYDLHKHPILVGIVFNNAYICKKFMNPYLALSIINDDNFMVLIREINVYCVFDEMKEFQRMASQIYSKMHESNDEFAHTSLKNLCFTPYQIFFSNQKQKIIILAFCRDVETIEKAAKICKEYFKKSVLLDSYDDGHILTIDKEVSDFTEVIEEINMFRNYINTYHMEMSRDIRFDCIKELQYRSDKYQIHNIGRYELFDANALTIDATKMLKRIPEASTIINNYTIINGSVNNGIINNNTIANTTNTINKSVSNTAIPNERHNKARTWIRNNLPKDETHSLEYYKRYIKSLNGLPPIKSAIFNDFVVDEGYINKKVGRHHQWYSAANFNIKN